MEIKVIENNKQAGKVTFILKDSTAAFANTLRRLATAEVPTMAVEEVEFSKNNSVLYDEIVAHRLGLVPLKTDLKSYNLPDKCKCEGKGCARCQLKLVLKSDKGDEMVYASQLKSKDPAVKPVYPDMPIVKLLKSQSIELEATAVLGKGKNHVKWSACHAYYKHKPVAEIDKGIKNPEEIVEAVPSGVFEIKNDSLVAKDSLYKYDLAGIAEKVSHGKVRIKNTNDFVFNIESFGQLSCKEILKVSMDVLDEQLDEIAELVKKLE